MRSLDHFGLRVALLPEREGLHALEQHGSAWVQADLDLLYSGLQGRLTKDKGFFAAAHVLLRSVHSADKDNRAEG